MLIEPQRHLGLAFKTARVVARAWSEDPDAWVGEAYEALIAACHDYSFWRSRGRGFAPYAVDCIAKHLAKRIRRARQMRQRWIRKDQGSGSRAYTQEYYQAIVQHPDQDWEARLLAPEPDERPDVPDLSPCIRTELEARCVRLAMDGHNQRQIAHAVGKSPARIGQLFATLRARARRLGLAPDEHRRRPPRRRRHRERRRTRRP